MALEIIEKHYEFREPMIKSGCIEFKNEIIDKKAVVVLRGVEPSFHNHEAHELKLFEVVISNPTVGAKRIDFTIEFDFKDDSGNIGSANIDVLAIAEVKEG